MAHPYILHEQARNEYIEAYGWYELHRVGLGVEFMDAVEQKLQQ